MHTKWNDLIKRKARELRQQGYSFGQLSKELKVPRSTLHQWVHSIKRQAKFTKQDRLRWIKEIQPLAAQANRKKREDMINQVISKTKIEIAKLQISQEMMKAMLSILYWAEGNKVRGGLQFVNTDPKLALLFIHLLRRCYKLDESKLRVRLHLHYYHKEKTVKLFWSKLLDIPTTQFQKTYRKLRSKEKRFRRNFGGICFIRYGSVYLKENIVQYGYALAESITGKVTVPVA